MHARFIASYRLGDGGVNPFPAAVRRSSLYRSSSQSRLRIYIYIHIYMLYVPPINQPTGNANFTLTIEVYIIFICVCVYIYNGRSRVGHTRPIVVVAPAAIAIYVLGIIIYSIIFYTRPTADRREQPLPFHPLLTQPPLLLLYIFRLAYFIRPCTYFPVHYRLRWVRTWCVVVGFGVMPRRPSPLSSLSSLPPRQPFAK